MLAEGHRLGGSNRQSLPTVQHTFETSGDTRVVVSELCLSTMCRLPKSSAANWRLVPRQTQTCLAVPRLYGVSTVPQTFASTFETRHVVSELCLSTVRRLPKSGAAKQRYVPCQVSTLLAMHTVCPRKLSEVPSQSLGSRRGRRTRRRVSTVCRTWSQVRSMQTANARPPAFPRLVPRVCLSAMCSRLWSTAPEQKQGNPRHSSRISCQTPAGVDVPDVPGIRKRTGQMP